MGTTIIDTDAIRKIMEDQKMTPLFQTANGIASEVTVARDRAEADVIAAEEGMELDSASGT